MLLKTIKKKKEVRIDELFKYITMNAYKLLDDKEFYAFKSNHGTDVTIDKDGKVTLSFMHYTPDDLFTVRVEEEITEDTKFERCVVLLESGAIYTPIRCNIKYIKENYARPIQVLARINEKLELIWEREEQ